MNSTTKQPAEQVALQALAAQSELTAADVAAAVGRGRSTVGKAL